jgi:uncharacterized protein
MAGILAGSFGTGNIGKETPHRTNPGIYPHMTATMPDSAAAVELGAPRARWQPLVCYLGLQVAFVPFQLWRLHQDDALTWLLIDLLGQVVTIGVLVAFSSGRDVLLRRDRLLIPPADAFHWILGILIVAVLLGFILPPLLARLPGQALGAYPEPAGWLLALHLTFGIALGAWLEEVVYRRLAFEALTPFIGSETGRVVVSAVIFSAIHWWTGLANLISTAILGVLFMLCYRRTGALWPAVTAHFLINLFWFGLT